MNRRLIGFLFVCSLVCAGTVRAEVQDEEVTRLNTSFNQVIKLEIDNLCNVLGGTELFSKVCTMLMSVTNIELLTTNTVVPKLCNLDDMTTTTIIPKLCTILDTVTTSCPRIPITAPLTISAPGSYCLANDISGQIVIAESNVTLDLNGYTIFDGITKTGTITDIVIKNGFVQSSSSGITFQAAGSVTQFIIENIVASDCVLDGFRLSAANKGVVRGCVFADNGLDGCLLAGSDVVIEDCTSNGNVGGGFELSGDRLACVRCTAINNTQAGFEIFGAAEDVVVRDCQAIGNSSHGFAIRADRCSLIGCSALSNNAGFSVESQASNVVMHECEAYNNSTGFGISLATGGGHHVQECRACNNGFGFFDASPNNATYLGNCARGNSVDYTAIPFIDLSLTATSATSKWNNVKTP